MDFLKQLREASLARIPDFNCGTLHSWSLAERGNELAGEAGELCNVLKKLKRIEPSLSTERLRESLIEQARQELGDVIISADLIAAQLGIDLEKAVRDKFNITSRKIGSDWKL